MFFSVLKAVYGPSRPSTTPLLSMNGARLKEKKAINERWREHFSTLLNRPSTVSNEALDQIPQRPTLDSLDLPASLEEVHMAIQQTSSGKSPGKDGIHAEIFKTVGPVALDTFHDLLCRIWEEEDMPQEFRDATIISIFKNKGSKSDCGNYQGISLLSIAGKILARVILNRLISNISEYNLPEAQCGFRSGRSTIDMIFAVRQVQEKCREQNLDLYAVFIDLTKAFDTVSRVALWTVLQKLGCPRKFVNLIRLFRDSMTGMVLSGGEASELFEITNGVKQGCVLAPVLFSLYFTSFASVQKQRRSKNVSWRLSLPTTVLSWHTRNLPSSSLSTSLLKHPASSASPSVLAKQKCCSSPALSYQGAIHPSSSREQS
ncbi:hypothetical protein ACOMHN_011542 [Nucella lapillus]